MEKERYFLQCRATKLTRGQLMMLSEKPKQTIYIDKEHYRQKKRLTKFPFLHAGTFNH